MQRGARNPKIFGSSYQPPTPKSSAKLSKSWRPIIFLILIISGVLLLGRLPIFLIKSIEFSGDPSSELQGRLDGLMGYSLFSGAIARRSSEISNRPEVDKFVCHRGIPSVLRCRLTLKQPRIVWQSGTSQYFIDDTGVIFAAASGDLSKMVVIEDTKQQPITLGQNIVSTTIIGSYQALIDALAHNGLTVSRLKLDESLYQVTAVIDRPGKSSIQGLFLLANDIGSQVSSVVTVMIQKGDAVTERIDVRVPGYVYVK